MTWGTALPTVPPPPIQCWHLFRDSRNTPRLLQSPSPREGNTCLLSDISVHYHLKGALCVPALSCTCCLIIHVILVQLAASRDTAWYTESARRSVPGVWLVGRVNTNQQGGKAMGQRRLNRRSLSVNLSSLNLEGVAYSQTHFERKIQLRLGFRVRLLPLRGVKHHSRWIKPAKQLHFTRHIFFSNSPFLCTLSSPLEKDKRQYVRYWARNELILSKWCSPGSLYVFFSPVLQIERYFLLSNV